MKKKILVANWKMNVGLKEGIKLSKSISKIIKNNKKKFFILLPSLQSIPSIKREPSLNKVKLGSQDCSQFGNGAYTGDVSAEMIKEIGCEYVLLGHSERRLYYDENDKILNKKIMIVQKQQLKVIFCVGESLNEYKQEKGKEVVKRQILKTFYNNFDFNKLIIAYEPLWAIGQNRTPKMEEIDDITKFIKKLVYKKYKFDNIPVLYGGSVNSLNSKTIFSLENVDGALVGGSSLKAKEFKKIYDDLN
mgnify:CR=1 FL=1